MGDTANTWSASEIARRIAAGETTAEAVMHACLERIAEREPEVRAFAHIDPEVALSAARAADAAAPSGPLHGVPVAVKDIIDVEGMPSAWGFPAYAGAMPRGDASAIALMRRAGAIPLGKSVTTELAYFTPGKTRNPRNLGHTPGGSSSGSAAAVADDMAPLALGSQTAASVIRPASFCGVVGYKPTIGTFDLQGVMGFAPSLDALGIMAREVGDIALARSVLDGTDLSETTAFTETPPRFALMRGPHWWDGSVAMRDVCQRASDALRAAGAEVGEQQHPESFDAITEAQKTVMAFEAARARLNEYARHRDVMSEQFATIVETGLATPRADYDEAQRLARHARRQLDGFFAEFDSIIAPAAPGEAPEGIGATGDPLYSRGWTLLHVPSITLPFGTGPAGLPLSVQLIGRHGEDSHLLAVARWAERALREKAALAPGGAGG